MKKLFLILVLASFVIGCKKEKENIQENNLPDLTGRWEMVNFNEYMTSVYKIDNGIDILLGFIDSISVDGLCYWNINDSTIHVSESYRVKINEYPYAEDYSCNEYHYTYYKTLAEGKGICLLKQGDKYSYIYYMDILSEEEFIISNRGCNFDDCYNYSYQFNDTTTIDTTICCNFNRHFKKITTN